MKYTFWLTGTIFMILTWATLTLRSKSANQQAEPAILSLTVSDQDRLVEKPSSVPTEEELV